MSVDLRKQRTTSGQTPGAAGEKDRSPSRGPGEQRPWKKT